MPRRLAMALASLVVVSGGARDLTAQLQADASVGGASHRALASVVDWNSAIVGIRYPGAARFDFSVGIPLDTIGAQWTAASFGVRAIRNGPVGIGIDADAQIFQFGTSAGGVQGGWGVVAEMTPVVRLTPRTPAIRSIEFRSGPTAFLDDPDSGTDVRRVHSSSAHVDVAAPGRIAVETVLRYVHSEGSGHPFAGINLSRTSSVGGLWGRFGHWRSSLVEGSDWNAGGFLNVGPRIQLYASYGTDATDPIYWNLPRRSWSAGASYSIGRSPRPGSPPDPVEIRGGSITIRVPREEFSQPPSVAGTFNDWSPHPMSPSSDSWVATFAVQPGVHHYSFRRADGVWVLPSSVTQRIPDGFGGENGVIVVR